jgi:hypothetical protein
MSTIVTGDTIALPVTLKKSGATFVIAAGATVQASLVSLDHRTVLAGPVTMSAAAIGADWDNSLVMIEMASSVTANIIYSGQVDLEVQVDDVGKLTWFFTLDLVQGTIA